MTTTSFVDLFIHSSYHSNPNDLRRARLFVRSCLVTSLFSTFLIWLSLSFEYDKGVYLMIFSLIGFLLLPFLAKSKLPFIWLGNLYVLVGAVTITILVYFSGGLWSAIYPWLISIPVLALLVVNRTSGLVWGGISLLLMLLFGVMAYRGIELSFDYNPAYKAIWFISISIGLLLIIMIIAFVFESIQSKTFNDLESKPEELIEDKDHFIRSLVHDLKNPLSNITLVTELLAQEQNESDRRSYIDMIDRASSNAHSLLDKVLEMHVLDHGTGEFHTENLDVNNSIKEVINALNESAKKKQIHIKLSNDSTKSEVNTDKIYLRQIFQNLISNAIKFSENGKSVEIVVTNDESHVRVKIMDQGPGIEEKEEQKLFKKFSKLSARPTAGETSAGLGLSLVKSYLDKIGGEVWYERNLSIGSTFIVQMPLTNSK